MPEETKPGQDSGPRPESPDERRRPRKRRSRSSRGDGSSRHSARSGNVQSRSRPPKETPPPPTGEDLVLVQFKGHRKGYYHNRHNLKLEVGQYCLVEADRGKDMGRIVYIGPGKAEWWVYARQQGVLGVASGKDLARLYDNRGDEWEFWDICREKIQARSLPMNLVTVERQFDHKKITFFFTAEKRVDFRELVRDLASIFRTRIELRQVGVRDEARLKGGIGICGREFCCSSFLHEFVPVTLKMAKVQQLPLNPSKLSGPCGRLRCCVTYEHETYRQIRLRLPRVGSLVKTPQGTGTVRKLDLLREEVMVTYPDQEAPHVWPAGDLDWQPEQNGGGCP